MATAALGHDTASSDDATVSQPNRATLRATAAFLDPSARQRRDGRVTVAVVRVEQQRRREQPWRRWDEAAILPLPRRNRTDGGVEKVEETTARLLTD